MGEGLRVHLFGEPRFEYCGSLHAFNAPPKTLPLVAFLLMHRRTPVARAAGAAALWPESDHVEALANLRRHLHYANKALPPPPGGVPWILADGRSIAWNPAAPYWLDVEVFESESQEQRYRAHAVRLYSGDLYERCADEWIFFDRERLRSLQMSNLAQLTAEARARNAYLQALQYAELMLALDPWREDALRSVLEIRALLGDRSGAAAEYERFAERLQSELGVTPSEQSVQLYERIRTKRDQSGAASATSPVTQPLVGRRNELAMLTEEWQRAAQGRGRLLLLGGEAGIGKTALVETLAAAAAEDGAQVLRGAAGIEAPYQPFLEVIRAAGGSAVTMAEVASAGGSAAGGERLQFFEAIANLLERAAAKPLLVVLEDLHEAGAETFDLLRYLAMRLSEAPVLFAATYREYEVGRTHPLRTLRRQLSRSGHLTHLAVTALDRESAAELVRARYPRLVDDTLMDRLYQTTGGNPLFLVELLHQYAQHRFDALPESVASIVRRRLRAVAPAARSVAEAAAIAGRACTVELAAQVTGFSEGETLEAFEQLGERHIVRESAPGAAAFSFVHDIVRTAIYDDIPHDILRRRHERIGLVLRELHADEFEQVAGVAARHLERGERFDEAAQAYAFAAEAALRVYALDEAQHCASRARDLTQRRDVCARALLVCEFVARSRTNREEQREALEALATMTGEIPESVQLDVAHRRAEFLIAANDSRADAALDELRQLAAGRPQIHPHFLAASGKLSHQRGDYAGAAGQLREAREAFMACGDTQRAIETYAALLTATIAAGRLQPDVIGEIDAWTPEDADARTTALIAHLRGRALYNYDPAGALAAGQQMLQAARVADDLWLEALAHRTIGACAGHLNQLSLSAEHLRLCADLTLAAGRPYDLASVRIFQAQTAWRAAFVEPGYEFAAEALSAARACGSKDLEVRAAAMLADLDIETGDAERALNRLAPLRDTAERFALGGVLPAVLLLYGSLQVVLEDPRAGIATLLESRRLAAQFKINLTHTFPLLGLSYMCADDRAAARSWAEEVAANLDAMRALFFFPHHYLWASAHLLHFIGNQEHAQAFAAAAYERYHDILSGIADEPMRSAFIAYRLNRAIVELHERGVWTPDPLRLWFSPGNLRRLGCYDAPSTAVAREHEYPQSGTDG
jgi:DNA-binding SARP family transcriptional activator